MRVKFVGLNAVEGQNAKGVWTGVKIAGTKLEDGSPWESSVLFHSNPTHKDWIAELESTEQGTPMNVKHVQDGRFWKMTDIVIGDDAVGPTNPTHSNPAAVRTRPARGSNGGSGNGTSRGDDTNRSAAIYLAKEFFDEDEYGEKLFVIAQDVYNYIANGVVPSFGDPLDPPKED
jgi:hypothetical protein